MTSIRKLDKGNTREVVTPLTETKAKAVEEELTVSYRELDKLIVTVSSAVLGLSVPFADKVIPRSPVAYWAVAAWFGYAVAVIAVMASLRIEQKHKNRILDTGNLTDTGVSVYSKRLNRANATSAWSFAVGTAFVAVFLLATFITTQTGK